ncbi:MAG TPA: hypothetical protein VKM55_24260 [Candidatus Lokiarchaeia archaeon]|nr:hypothetical protein [Candidatus Lokiarchaeia archaeon]
MLRPYLKFLIAGGVVTGEGGSVLASGLMYIMLSRLMTSMMSFSSLLSGSDAMLMMMGIPFLVAGIVSLIIGLVLLGKGIARRKEWLAMHPQDTMHGIAGSQGLQNAPIREQPYPGVTREPSFEQLIIRQPASSGVSMRRRCNNCGTEIPDNVDMIYCPSCGRRL